ncbi:hypothetical protein HYQ46_007517 [Verticillium longisporum]|nr:hypothetical protein HYQ46_007517 [Verticillium longisporum]
MMSVTILSISPLVLTICWRRSMDPRVLLIEEHEVDQCLDKTTLSRGSRSAHRTVHLIDNDASWAGDFGLLSIATGLPVGDCSNTLSA